MTNIRRRLLVTSLVTGALVVALTGCATPQSEAEKVAVQEAQLSEYIDQADAWGADIIAQIPADEPAEIYLNDGGPRLASGLYEEWPKYYYWSQGAMLQPDGPRTPTELADDLEPWLEEQGWRRNPDTEFPPGKESFTRDYLRGPYHLAVEVYTEAPPRAQNINFTIVTPTTNPNRG